MSVRGGRGSATINTAWKGAGPSGGTRLPKSVWARFRHLTDEQLAAKGIPLRMVRRMRKAEQ